MNEDPTKIRIGLHILMCGLAPMLYFIVSAWLPLQPFGAPWMTMLSTFGVFIWLLVVVATVISLLLCIPQKTRKKWLLRFMCLTSISFFSVIGLMLIGKVRMNEFEKLGINSTYIIRAVEEFRSENGFYPTKLDQLIPGFLPQLPKTGMGAYPNYKIIMNNSNNETYENDWILMVDCPSGILNWDVFIYFPNGNYPKQAYGGYLKPIGNWAYVCE